MKRGDPFRPAQECISVGQRFQADTNITEHEPVISTTSGLMKCEWDPCRLSPDAVTKYLNNLKEKGVRCEEDEALHYLHQANYRVSEAVKKMVSKSKEEGAPCGVDPSVLVEFNRGMNAFGRNFRQVQQCLPSFSVREIIGLYYKWKCTKDYQVWRRNARERLATDKIPDFHNDSCEICERGGNLICCDTCSLAYHLPCLTPPLADFPVEDWYCPVCEAEHRNAEQTAIAKRYVETMIEKVESRRAVALNNLAQEDDEQDAGEGGGG